MEKNTSSQLTTAPSDISKIIWYLSFFLTLGITLIVHIVIRNNFVKNRTRINELISDINVQLKKRRDTLIKLVDAAKDYIKYEKSILTDVTKLRKFNLEEEQPKKVDATMKTILNKITAVGENYPNLKANTTVVNLMDQAAYLEREIAAARRLYNSQVSIFNARLFTYPTNIIGNGLHFERLNFIEISSTDEQDVSINLNT